MHYFFIQVLPSQRQSDKVEMYNAWVLINKKYGWILTANCTCMAGLGSACSHVAALLFKIEAICFFKSRDSITPTDVSCSWLECKKSVQPAPLSCLSFKRIQTRDLPEKQEIILPESRNASTCNSGVGKWAITLDDFAEIYKSYRPFYIFF